MSGRFVGLLPRQQFGATRVTDVVDLLLGNAMCRTIQVGLAIMFGCSVTGAAAADLPVKALPMAPSLSWTGFYVGGDVGAGWSSGTNRFSDPNSVGFVQCFPCSNGSFGAEAIRQSGSSFLGGLHGGYNYQFASKWIVGIEADASWTKFRQASNAPLVGFDIAGNAFNVPQSNLNFQTDINWLASFRGRFGFTQDSWLLYATGGIAWADMQFRANATCTLTITGCFNTPPIKAPLALGGVRTGWVVGGGAEWQAPASPWRVRAEYLYYGLESTNSGTSIFISESQNAPSNCVGVQSCSAVYNFGGIHIHTARVGLSYAFR
jgi:outer membrane immunogenic protein